MQEKIMKIQEELNRKIENGEFKNQHEIAIFVLEQDNEKKVDEIRRKSIVKWLKEVVENFDKLKQIPNILEMIQLIEEKKSLERETVLSLIDEAFSPKSMPMIFNMLNEFYERNVIFFQLNTDPEKPDYLSMLHTHIADVEDTKLVLTIGEEQKIYQARNFMHGFLAIFIMQEMLSFYDLNFTMKDVLEKDIIDAVLNVLLAEMK